MKIKFYYVLDGKRILHGPSSRRSCRKKTKLRLMSGEKVHWIEFQTNKRGNNYVERCVLSYPLWITRKHFKELEEERDRKKLVNRDTTFISSFSSYYRRFCLWLKCTLEYSCYTVTSK